MSCSAPQSTQASSQPKGKAAIVTREEFLEQLGEMLEAEGPLTGAEVLKDLESWDSLAAISFMALADGTCGVRVAPKDIGGCNTVSDLAALVSAGFENPAQPERA